MIRSALTVALTLLAMACGSVSDKSHDAAVQIDSPPAACAAGATAMCSGNDLITCDAQGNQTGMQTCALGCNPTELRCNKVNPSNGLAAFLDEAAGAPALTLMGSATIDTDSGTITDSTGTLTPPTSTITAGVPVPVFVIKAKTFSAGNVVVTGARALAIVSDGAVSVTGVVSVSARQDASGPGALTTDVMCRGANGTAGTTNGQAGGGGGGFGTAGGKGGNGGSPTLAGGASGATSGAIELSPLRGGCNGGHASALSATHFPGGGGGAIQIVSNASIAIEDNGFVAANGGGARGPVGPIFCIVGTPCGDGEGGGSGGAILLEAPVVTVAAAGGIVANGGAGKCNVFGSAPNGSTSGVATGQACGGDTGSGGNGAAGITAATNGVNGSGSNPVGGGGGGGNGRIRINVPLGTTFTPAGTLSGASTVGVLTTR